LEYKYSTGGKNMIFFPPVSKFFPPSGHAITSPPSERAKNCLGGEIKIFFFAWPTFVSYFRCDSKLKYSAGGKI
jgi:hypothetical protein